MKSLLITAIAGSVVLSSIGWAHGPEFTLNCVANSKHARQRVAYQVIKEARHINGRWSAQYKVRALSAVGTVSQAEFALQAAGSGDEDYDEYQIVDPQRSSGLTGAYIQNRFSWVSLIDTKGVAAYDCRREYK